LGAEAHVNNLRAGIYAVTVLAIICSFGNSKEEAVQYPFYIFCTLVAPTLVCAMTWNARKAHKLEILSITTVSAAYDTTAQEASKLLFAGPGALPEFGKALEQMQKAVMSVRKTTLLLDNERDVSWTAFFGEFVQDTTPWILCGVQSAYSGCTYHVYRRYRKIKSHTRPTRLVVEIKAEVVIDARVADVFDCISSSKQYHTVEEFNNRHRILFARQDLNSDKWEGDAASLIMQPLKKKQRTMPKLDVLLRQYRRCDPPLSSVRPAGLIIVKGRPEDMRYASAFSL
jgi:hypothetical protein